MSKPRARCGDELADAPEAERCRASSRTARRRSTSSGPICLRCSDCVRLRDVAREREQQRHRVLGGGDDVRLRRVGDDDARAWSRPSTSTLSTPTPARPITRRRVGLLDQLGGHLRRRADQDPVVARRSARASSLVVPVDAEVDVEVLAQQLDAGVADLLLDEHLQARPLVRRSRVGGAHAATLSTTQSMQAVSACTSAGSTAGNMPTRSWLRPSLR